MDNNDKKSDEITDQSPRTRSSSRRLNSGTPRKILYSPSPIKKHVPNQGSIAQVAVSRHSAAKNQVSSKSPARRRIIADVSTGKKSLLKSTLPDQSVDIVSVSSDSTPSPNKKRRSISVGRVASKSPCSLRKTNANEVVMDSPSKNSSNSRRSGRLSVKEKKEYKELFPQAVHKSVTPVKPKPSPKHGLSTSEKASPDSSNKAQKVINFNEEDDADGSGKKASKGRLSKSRRVLNDDFSLMEDRDNSPLDPLLTKIENLQIAKKVSESAKKIDFDRDMALDSPPCSSSNQQERPERSTLEQIKERLHTSEVPEKMLNRETECSYIQKYILNGIKKSGQSQSLYISGVPGTGKTASVLKVVDTNAQQKLNQMFSFVRKKPVILLIDELDMLLTKKQEVVYSVFNWAAIPESKVNIIAISNTLDLPERALSQRVASRLGSNRLCFQPYDHNQITEIIQYRISHCPAIGKAAVEYAARKIASLSGDLRKALELVRRSIEIAVDEFLKTDREKEQELTFSHVNQAIQESTSSIRVEMCLGMSHHEEALFRAMTRDLHKSALEEAVFYRLLDEYKEVCFGFGLEPLSSSALFRLLLEMASSRIFNLSPEAGEMNRKIQLGFSLPEAQFCVRQLDLRKNNQDNPQEFARAAVLMLTDWKTRFVNEPAALSFVEYFEKTWLHSPLSGWYEGFSAYSSTNNGLESKNGELKKVQRRRGLPLAQFITICRYDS
uniref:Origin recognition complex subunit 1 n=1 Tax=Ditylenchus dipsaci TaxID=166011 RepID=A0A915DRN8_9BILA